VECILFAFIANKIADLNKLPKLLITYFKHKIKIII